MNFALMITLSCLWLAGSSAQDIDPTFRKVISLMEADVKDLALYVERLYGQRCEVETLESCAYANYEHCRSELPSPRCLVGDGPNDCGDGKTCNRISDSTVTSVRIHKDLASGLDGNPESKDVIESLCFTRELDAWFQAKRENTSIYRESVGIKPGSMYFGSSTGAFRIYPAQYSIDCDFYDPRLRPWYIAASSGPKNVVMLLDISNSMRGERLRQLKWAAKRVLNTLTESDYVAIVVFSSTARYIDESYAHLEKADGTTKANLTALIDKLETEGLTNFVDAFGLTFNLIEESLLIERDSECTTAILFLTDGVANYPLGSNESVVKELVVRRLEEVTTELQKLRIDRSIFLFTYSVAGAEPNVHAFPSELACAVNQGIWSKISEEEEIVHSLSSYYKLFSLGIGKSDFSSWVHPYEFATGGMIGTSVSVPVFDRSNDPPILLGVVGMDLSLTALANALGATADEIQEILVENIDYIAELSATTCPVLQLDDCDLESYRRHSGSNCTSSCVSIANVHNSLCNASRHPEFLWANVNATPLDVTTRACCVVADVALNATGQCSIARPIRPIHVATFAPSPFVPTAVLSPRSKAARTLGPRRSLWATLAFLVMNSFY